MAAMAAIILTQWLLISSNKNEIADLTSEIVKKDTISEVNNRWIQATQEMTTTLIAEQNAAIDRVTSSVESQVEFISKQVKQQEDTNKKDMISLKKYITDMPEATDCAVMSDNFVKFGGDIKW